MTGRVAGLAFLRCRLCDAYLWWVGDPRWPPPVFGWWCGAGGVAQCGRCNRAYATPVSADSPEWLRSLHAPGR